MKVLKIIDSNNYNYNKYSFEGHDDVYFYMRRLKTRKQIDRELRKLDIWDGIGDTIRLIFSKIRKFFKKK